MARTVPQPRNVPQPRQQVGAVLVFRRGVTMEDAEQALRTLDTAGLLESAPRIQTFDPRWGHPVWYVP